MYKAIISSVGVAVLALSTAHAQCSLTRKAAACGSVGQSCGTALKAATEEPEITTGALSALIQSDRKALVFDARTAKYDDGRRIPGATSLPVTSDDAVLKAAAGNDTGALIVTYCSSRSCPAGGMLASKLRKLGYTNVLEYPDGIKGWAESGETVVNAKADG